MYSTNFSGMPCSMIVMPMTDWYAVPINPRQRNTEQRAKWAINKHLKHYHKRQVVVEAAVLNGDIICKIDGHTRTYLWENGLLEIPSQGKVCVILTEVESWEEAADCYEVVDSPQAYKTGRDRLQSELRKLKIQLDSQLFRAGKIVTQLRIASSGTHYVGEPKQTVKIWKKELKDLDKLNLSNKHSTLISAMLLTTRLSGIDISGQFWKSVDDDLGSKTSKGSDAVDLLNRHMEIRKAGGRMNGFDNLTDIAEGAIWVYDQWLDSRNNLKKMGRKSLNEMVQQLVKQRIAIPFVDE